MKLYRSTVVIVAALFDLASAQLATAQIGELCIKELSGIGTDTVDPGCGVDGPFQTFVFQSQKPGPLVVYLDEPSIGDGIRTQAELFGPFDTAAEACPSNFGPSSVLIGINTDPCDGPEDTSCLSLGLTYKENEEGKFYALDVLGVFVDIDPPTGGPPTGGLPPCSVVPAGTPCQDDSAPPALTATVTTDVPDCSGGFFTLSPNSIPVIRQTKVTFIYLDSEGEDKCGKASKGTKTDSTKTSKTTKAPKRIR